MIIKNIFKINIVIFNRIFILKTKTRWFIFFPQAIIPKVINNKNVIAINLFFIITDGVDNGYYMSSDNLKEMQAAGMSIENHTANHLELNGLSKEDAYDSIKRAQDYLRNVIGSDGNYLCYPVGKYNDETIAIEEELGIKAAVTTQGGIASINDGIHTLKRVRISPMSIDSFASIFSEYIN